MTTDDSWPPLDLDEEEPTQVTQLGDVTREHDGGEWLAGFNRGVAAGRHDVMEALRKVLGTSPVGQDIEVRVMAVLAEAAKR